MRYLSSIFTLAFLPFELSALSSTRSQDVTKSSASAGGGGGSKLFQEPDMEAYSKGFSSVTSEISNRLCKAEVGVLPDDLSGTYYRSGPAMFTAGSIPPMGFSAVNPKEKPVPDGADMQRMVKHPFDGDGAVLAVTFHPEINSCTARYRFVKTAAFENERKKGKKLYDGMDSTRLDGNIAVMHPGNDFPLPLFRYHLQPGLNKKKRNTSNTRAVFWGKRLLSMWEGGLPYKIDSLALSTEGKSQLGGVLPPDASFSGKATYDSNKDRMLFYSFIQDANSSEVKVYEFDNNFKLVGNKNEQKEFKLPGYALFNDFAVTDRFSIFVQPAVEVNTFPFMMSKDPSKSISLKSDGEAILHLAPRVGVNTQMISIPIPKDSGPESDVDLHFCNAYEATSDEIVFDVIRSDLSKKKKSITNWPWVSSLTDYSLSVSRKSLWRYRFNISSGKIEKTRISDINCHMAIVNPSYSGKEHRFIYSNVGALGNEVAPPQGIAKFDCMSNSVEQWLPESHEFAGEPMYASRKGVDPLSAPEDDGYILSVLLNGKTNESEIVVLRANNITAGPIARLSLGMAIPHGLFGCFVSDEAATWSAEELERRAKLADKMEKKGNRWNEVKSDFSGLGLRLDDFDEYFGDLL